MISNPPITLTFKSKDALIDSRLIAAHLGIHHANVIATIKGRQSDFEELGKVMFQTGPSGPGSTGQRMKFALLYEDQAYFLLTLSRNTPRVVALKLNLVKAFRDSRMAVEAYQAGTLPSFKGLQDSLKSVPGGPGPWLFSNVNKLINATAGIATGTRSKCEAVHQAMLTMLQGIAAHAVAEAADAKDAYYRVKEALLPFSKAGLMRGAT